MKILIATGIYPPDIGGPATYSKLLNDELPKRGVAVEVLSFGAVRHLPKIVRHAAYLFKALARARSADIVFAQDTVSVGLPALLAARLAGKRFFVRVPGDYAWEQAVQRFHVTDSIDDFQHRCYGFRTGLLRKVQRFVVGSADEVIAPSLYFQKLVSGWSPRLAGAKRNGAPAVRVIYNGIEESDATGAKDEISDKKGKARAKVRAALGIPAAAKLVVSAGRLVPWKGFEALIRAASELKREGFPLLLHIVGSGPDEAKLRALIAERDMADEIVLSGSLTRPALTDALAAADLFILNTGFESFSFQIIEAMRLKTPIIATTAGNIPELIDDGKEGRLVRFNDEKALVAALRELLEDGPDAEALRARYADNAYEKSQRFSIEATLDELVKLF